MQRSGLKTIKNKKKKKKKNKRKRKARKAMKQEQGLRMNFTGRKVLKSAWQVCSSCWSIRIEGSAKGFTILIMALGFKVVVEVLEGLP